MAQYRKEELANLGVPGLKSQTLPSAGAATNLRFEWNPITLQSGPQVHVERIF